MGEFATIRDLIYDTVGDDLDEINSATRDYVVDRLERVIADLLHRPDKSVYGDLMQFATRLDAIDAAILGGRIKPCTLVEYALLDELRTQVRGQLHELRRLDGDIENIGLWLARHQNTSSVFTPYSARVISDLEKRIDTATATK